MAHPSNFAHDFATVLGWGWGSGEHQEINAYSYSSLVANDFYGSSVENSVRQIDDSQS